jgi:cholesterol 7alpha-monooxygenase
MTPFSLSFPLSTVLSCNLLNHRDILHSDPDIFENPQDFIYDRFLNKDKPNDFSYASGAPLTHQPVMAFGGGQHLCPGRKFIAYENRLLLAMMMLNFDIVLAEKETIPSINTDVQGIGVSQPKNDVIVEIKRRT